MIQDLMLDPNPQKSREISKTKKILKTKFLNP